MAILYPKHVPDTSPASEISVFRSLTRLNDHWRVFHSVVWQSARRGRQADGEADFVLLHPRYGLLVLEVKGGRVDIVDGSWYYDRYDPAACRANHLARASGGGWTRRVFAFHRPERLAGWLDEPDTSRSSLLKRAFEGRLS